MALYEGTTMRIKIGGKTLFHETDCSLSSSIAFKDVASKDTSGVISIPGAQTWSISTNSLVAESALAAQEDLKTLYATHVGKTKVTVEFTTDVSGDVVFTGQAYIETYNLKSTHEETVTGDFNFKGDGDLSMGTVAP